MKELFKAYNTKVFIQIINKQWACRRVITLQLVSEQKAHLKKSRKKIKLKSMRSKPEYYKWSNN